MKVGKFDSYENYILYDLKQAQERINQYHDEMFQAALEIKKLRADVINKDIVITNLEKTIDSLKEKLKKHV